MRVLWCVLITVLMTGCFEPEDGQFLCDDENCPDGTRCFDGVCLVNAPEIDAGGEDGGLDARLMDSAPDFDAGADAFVVMENCSPNENGAAVDEDGDGAIDEDCLWFFGEPHLVEGANLAKGNVFGIAFGEARDVAYLSAQADGVAIQQIQRTNIHDPFAPDTVPVPVAGTEPTIGAQNAVITVSADGLLLVAQSTTQLIGWERPTAVDNFLVADLNLPANAVHPSLSPNGLELYYATTASPRRIFRVQRSARALSFGPAEPVNVGNDGPGSVHFPRVSSDGMSLFFTNQRGIEVATRNSLDAPFEGGEVLSEELPIYFVLPTYLPDLREMWMVAPAGTPWSPPKQSVWRVQVCRDGPCVDEPRPPCGGDGSQPSDSGFSCYLALGDMRTWGGARDLCQNSGGSQLASISSAEEIDLTRAFFGRGDQWIGINRLTTSPDFVWQSGEPVLYLPWNDLQPSSLGFNMECVILSGNGFSSERCSTLKPVLCERRQLPSWTTSQP